MKIPENTQMDADFWRDVERARRMTPQERIAESCSLSDRSFRIMLDGVRHQFPQATPSEIVAKLQARLTILRELEARRWTPPKSPNE
jgi:hypothetical protein